MEISYTCENCGCVVKDANHTIKPQTDFKKKTLFEKQLKENYKSLYEYTKCKHYFESVVDNFNKNKRIFDKKYTLDVNVSNSGNFLSIMQNGEIIDNIWYIFNSNVILIDSMNYLYIECPVCNNRKYFKPVCNTTDDIKEPDRSQSYNHELEDDSK